MEASALPKGFATGSAVGSFIPDEAPSMGSLPIKGTIIHLTDGPSHSWAAVFTKNQVSDPRVKSQESRVESMQSKHFGIGWPGPGVF